MKIRPAAIVGTLVVSLYCVEAKAGQELDQLSTCLVKSASETDKKELLQWLYSTLALTQTLKDVITVTPEEHEKLTQKAAAIFERLWTKDCATELIKVKNTEGLMAAVPSISALAQSAAYQLTKDPVLVEGMKDLVRRIDWGKMPTTDDSKKP